MRWSLLTAAVLSLLIVNTADAQRRGVGGGRGRGGVSIGFGTGYGGYYGGYGRSGIGISLGSSPYYGGYGYGRSGISIGIGSGYYGSGYGGYGGYGRSSFYSPGYGGYGFGYSRPYSTYHRGWNSGSWTWANSPAFWSSYSSASVFGGSGTLVYSNPFVYNAPISVGSVNYSQPLPGVDTMPDLPEEAQTAFNDARTAFRQGDYSTALSQVDKAIAKAPADTNLSEFRALCLFALKDYKKAAQVLYPVLAAGPGWNWDTIKALYGESSTYTAQLRDLEDYYLAHKDDAAASFVLAYHYLVLDYPKNARTHLENVARLLPDDKLAPELLKALPQ